MRILGIDCGTERTGYGVIDSDGSRHTLLGAGTIRSSAKDPLATRLVTIAEGLRQVCRHHAPQAAAVEQVFHATTAAGNTATALKLAHVRGVALLLLAEQGLDVGEYSPAEVKSGVVGHGRADKAQVARMVASVLRLQSAELGEDAYDALAVAICHATRCRFADALASPARAAARA